MLLVAAATLEEPAVALSTGTVTSPAPSSRSSRSRTASRSGRPSIHSARSSSWALLHALGLVGLGILQPPVGSATW